MQHDTHIRRLLLATDALQSGALERLVLNEAIAIADDVQHDELGYEARLRLISACALSGDTEGRLAAVDWAVAHHFADPVRFPARLDSLDLIWEFTTVPDAVARSGELGRETVDQTLDTLRSLLTRHGESPCSAAWAELRVARLIGDPDREARAAADLRGAMPDSYSPCVTCRQCEQAALLSSQNRFDEAAALFDLALEHPNSCEHQPEEAYAKSLAVYLNAAQPKKAARSHQLGYDLIKNSRHRVDLAALHIDYCRRIRSFDRARELIEHHLPWIAVDPLDTVGQFEALHTLAVTLDALVAADQGDEPVRSTEHPMVAAYFGLGSQPIAHVTGDDDAPDARALGPLSTRSLAHLCHRGAQHLAAELDARNGNDHYSQRVRAAPATALSARPAVDARLARSGEPALSPVQASFASLPAEAPASELWWQLARERATAEDSAGARAAISFAHEALDREARNGIDGVGSEYIDAIDDRSLALAEPDFAALHSRQQHVRAGLYGLEITFALERGDRAEAERLAGLRADVLIDDDRLDLAEVELQVGLLMFGAEQPPGSGTLERALTAARQARIEPEAEVSILNALAELRLKQGRPSEATSFMLTAVKLCGHDPDSRSVQRPLILLAHAQLAEGSSDGVVATTNRLLRHPLDRATRANALLLRASASHRLSRLNAGVADADRALSLYVELGYSKGIIDACTRLALLLEELGVQAGVAEAWRQAATEAERINHPETSVIRFRLARALINAGLVEEAISQFDDVLEDALSGGAAAAEICEVLYWLGHACRIADDDDLAFAAWNAALSLAATAADWPDYVRLGLALGRLLLDESDDSSVSVLQKTVDQARLVDDPWQLVDALHLLGQAQCEFELIDGLHTFDEAVAVADRHAFDIDALLATITESRAHGLDALGRDTEALDAARRSARLYERLGERASAGLVRLFAARMLALEGSLPAAHREYERSVELLAGDGATVAQISRELRELGA